MITDTSHELTQQDLEDLTFEKNREDAEQADRAELEDLEETY